MSTLPVTTSRQRVRSWPLRIRRELTWSDRLPMGFMTLCAVAVTVGGTLRPELVPYNAMILPMFVGSLWLGPRTLPWFVVLCLLGTTVMVGVQPTINERSVIRILVTFALGLLILLTSFRRARLGVSGPRSESMFVDLRDRITNQSRVPALPQGWYADAAVRTAGGTAFAGDFIVAGGGNGESNVAITVVDVSGKGVEAGTRSLLLAGALGGLLTALYPAEFLPAANDYLLRQDWPEGFATAVHLHLDTSSGAFSIRKAGHPPAVWLQAGSGGTRVLESDGPILGLLRDAEFEEVSGVMGPGDALMLFTDGLVERGGRRDIDSGIDRLAGVASRLLRDGFDDGARRILDELGNPQDDCAVVVVHRRPGAWAAPPPG